METQKKKLSSIHFLRHTHILVNCYVWNVALYGAETWTLGKEDQKYPESVEMLCWRRMKKIGWVYRKKNWYYTKAGWRGISCI